MHSTPHSTEPIQVGTGCVTINPPLGLPLAGFPSERANTGGSLDLCARSMVIAEANAPAPQAALIVLDNLGASPDVVNAIRAAAAQRVGGLAPASILVAATHTHSAPGLRHFGPAKKGKAPAVDPGYVAQVVAASADAIEQAWKNRRPVRMRVGRGEAHLHHNRRVVDADGKATNVWLDVDGKHTGYTDPAVAFVVFDDATTGRPAAMIVSYACHPVALGPGNVKTSPDYPGYLVRTLEAATGAATVLHLTGAGADINPRDCLRDEPDQARRMGEALAAAVRDRLDEAVACEATPIRVAAVPLELRLGPNARANYSNRAADSVDGKTLTSEVQAIRIGDLVLVSAPGELFSQIGAQMEQSSPAPYVLVVGYANDYLGYLFTDAAFAEGGYEPSSAISETIEQPLVAAASAAMRATMA